jgi:hypothetical protein
MSDSTTKVWTLGFRQTYGFLIAADAVFFTDKAAADKAAAACNKIGQAAEVFELKGVTEMFPEKLVHERYTFI